MNRIRAMTTQPDRTPHPRWRAFWALLVALLIIAETGALRRALYGDTLSETVWWLYGPAFGLRWWILGSCVTALLIWASIHFMHPPVATRALIAAQLVALVVGLAGWMLTRG